MCLKSGVGVGRCEVESKSDDVDDDADATIW